MTTFLPPLNFYGLLTAGDSINNGTADSTPPAAGRGGWQPMLCSLLSRAQNVPWCEIARLSTGGWKVSDLKANIDSLLAGLPASTPTPALFWVGIGINDNGLADLRSDLRYIMDAVHNRFPPTPQVYDLIWGPNRDSGVLATINSYITDAVVSRSSFCGIGVDWFTVLEGGNNGATTIADGTHPNRVGYTTLAGAKKTRLLGS